MLPTHKLLYGRQQGIYVFLKFVFSVYLTTTQKMAIPGKTSKPSLCISADTTDAATRGYS